MNAALSALLLTGTIIAAGSAAYAQTSPDRATRTNATAKGMTSMCEDMMADPVVRTRMNAIMQKHMQSMMRHGMMQGGTMQGGSAQPEPQHSPAATP